MSGEKMFTQIVPQLRPGKGGKYEIQGYMVNGWIGHKLMGEIRGTRQYFMNNEGQTLKQLERAAKNYAKELKGYIK